jgi:hypothetical protein
MPVTRLTVRVVAALVLLGVALFAGASPTVLAPTAVLVGLLLVFPIDQFLALGRLFLNRRPPPLIYPTAIAADPREGYIEDPDDDLIGVILERRRLASERARDIGDGR